MKKNLNKATKKGRKKKADRRRAAGGSTTPNYGGTNLGRRRGGEVR